MKSQNTQSSIQQTVDFPAELYSYIQQSAKKYGVDVSEYIRMLAFNDVHSTQAILESFDDDVIESVGRSLKQIQTGDTVTVDPQNEKELDNVLGISS